MTNGTSATNLPLFLSVRQIASLIGRSDDFVYMAINNGRLNAMVLGERKKSVLRTEFERWIAEGAPTKPLELPAPRSTDTTEPDDASDSL